VLHVLVPAAAAWWLFRKLDPIGRRAPSASMRLKVPIKNGVIQTHRASARGSVSS
jgi:hypothetical protein